MRVLITTLVFGLFSLFSPAHAQCVAPHGEMGVIIFNKDHKVMQYCNGDDWVGIWGSGGSALPSCADGEVAQYSGGGWACNDGSGLDNLNATNLKSGTVPVARLGASGTRNNTTFLRGDNTWAAVASGAQITGIQNYSSAAGGNVTSGLHSFCVLSQSHDSSNIQLARMSGPNAAGKSTFRCNVSWGPSACSLMCFDF